MKRRRWVGAVLASALVAGFFGCAVSPYRQAESYISQKEYRQALQIYLKALNPRMVNGKRVLGYDPEAMTGIGVVLYHMKRHATAVKVLERVVKRTPQYGKAVYYLGGCQEALKKPEKAAEAYRRYALLETTDPYRDALRWRYEWISRQTLAQEVRRAIAEEPAMPLSALPGESVAVLYFQNLSKAQWAPLQKGLAQLLSEDLAEIDGLRVTGRDRIQRTMESMGWTAQAMAADSRTAQVGKLLGARTLVKGSFKILPGDRIEVRVGTVYVPESKTAETLTYTGTLDQLFSMEKRMIRRIAADMGITLTPEAERRLAGPATRDFKAFVYFSLGLNQMDAGKFEQGQKYFRQALGLDPDFFMAQDWVVDPALYRATHQGSFAAMTESLGPGFGESGAAAGPAATGAFAVTPAARLQELGMFMDAGFLPGADSRDLADSPVDTPPPDTGPRPLSPAPAPPYEPVRWVLPGPPGPPSRR
jgi:tetratricopeptide (TPR) repeat protein